MAAPTSLVLVELVGVVAELVLIVLMIGTFIILYKAVQRQHADSVALLSFIETQIRTTRHAIRNLTAALNLQSAVTNLEGDEDIDEGVAQR